MAFFLYEEGWLSSPEVAAEARVLASMDIHRMRRSSIFL